MGRSDVNKMSLTDLLLLEGQVIRKRVMIVEGSIDRAERVAASKSRSRSRSPPEAEIKGKIKSVS